MLGHRGTGVPGDGVGSASVVVVSDDAATLVVVRAERLLWQVCGWTCPMVLMRGDASGGDELSNFLGELVVGCVQWFSMRSDASSGVPS